VVDKEIISRYMYEYIACPTQFILLQLDVNTVFQTSVQYGMGRVAEYGLLLDSGAGTSLNAVPEDKKFLPLHL
jgi:hypothetical protein